MTYRLLSQKTLGEPQYIASTGYYYYGENQTQSPPFNEIKLDVTFPNLSINDRIDTISEQSDGKMYICGNFSTIEGYTIGSYAIARLNSDGSFDSSFSAIFNNDIEVIKEYDNKIIIGGNFSVVNSMSRNSIARLDRSGNVDLDFNPNCNGSVYAIAVQSDGKILIGGNFTTVGGTTRNRIARLMPNGTLDASFNPNLNSTCYAIAIAGEGKILIGGAFTTVGGASEYYFARLNEDGSLDPSFNSNTEIAGDTPVYDIVLCDDKKIIIRNVSKLMRLNPDSTTDSTFTYSLLGSVKEFAVQKDGKIILYGENYMFTGYDSLIYRLLDDGTIDESFGLKITSPAEGIDKILIRENGKFILVGGFTSIDGQNRKSIAQFKKNINNAPYTELYECPSGSVIVESIFVANHNDFLNSIDIAVLPDGESTVQKKHHIVWDHFIGSNGYAVFKPRVPLNIGDRVFGYSTVDELMSINIFGKNIV